MHSDQAPDHPTTLATEVRIEQRRHWDAVARAMPDLWPAASTQYYQRCEIALIRRTVGSLTGKRVLKLDLWNEAMNTRILHWMQAQGAQVVGLDLSQVVASRAHHNTRTRSGSRLLLQADIRYLPFASHTFDVVYTMGTIEHIDEYQDAVDEVSRVLNPGGKALIGVPHKWDPFLRPVLVWMLELFERYPYSPERAFSARELRRVIEQSGLRVVRRTGILSSPALIRMIDLFLFRRNIPIHTATTLALLPFDVLETRFPWMGYLGYLLVLEAEKHGAKT